MGVNKVQVGLVISLILTWVLFGLSVYSTRASHPANSVYESSEDMIAQVIGYKSPERPSPKDRIQESQIRVYDNRIVIDFENAQWATFTDTNSMDPVIDAGSNAIEYVPSSPSEISVGDIVSYNAKYSDGVIIHRVIEIGYDDDGWYAIMKGDNNPHNDPGKVRFDQVERIVVGIIY